ncbi:hypothetical protein D9M68_607750 [compost metagenome]
MVPVITASVNNFGQMLFLEECRSQIEIKYDTMAPINGASTIKPIMTSTPVGISPAFPSLYQFTTFKPAWAIAAPAKPPIKVCEELEGIPNHQVSKFQIIAAITPARITTRLISMVCAVLATVSATPNPKTQ